MVDAEMGEVVVGQPGCGVAGQLARVLGAGVEEDLAAGVGRHALPQFAGKLAQVLVGQGHRDPEPAGLGEHVRRGLDVVGAQAELAERLVQQAADPEDLAALQLERRGTVGHRGLVQPEPVGDVVHVRVEDGLDAGQQEGEAAAVGEQARRLEPDVVAPPPGPPLLEEAGGEVEALVGRFDDREAGRSGAEGVAAGDALRVVDRASLAIAWSAEARVPFVRIAAALRNIATVPASESTSFSSSSRQSRGPSIATAWGVSSGTSSS